MASNFKEFEADAGIKYQKIEAETSDDAVRIVLEIHSRTVLKTPTDAGILKNNWYLTIGSPSGEMTESEDPSGTAVISRAIAAAQGFKLGQSLWLTNNSPYAVVWEFGTFVPPDPGPSKDPREGRLGVVLVQGGYSLQAPQGFLGISIEEVVSALRN
jgi:hypothetical protein